MAALGNRSVDAFLAIVEHGSLGRAADVLHVTQPALSRTVRRLEAEVGAPLFERHSTGMELNAFGRALMPHLALLQSEAEAAVAEIRAMRGLSSGRIRVGAVASIATSVLPACIDRLLGRSPGLNVQVVEAVEDRLEAALLNNEIDIAVAGQIAESKDIMRAAESAFSDLFTVVASPAHQLRDRQPLHVEDILSAQWVMPPVDTLPRQQFDAMLAARGLPPLRVAVETRSLSTNKALVSRSSFLSWLPRPVYFAEEAMGLIAPLPCETLTMERRFCIYRRRRGHVAPAIARMIGELARDAGSTAHHRRSSVDVVVRSRIGALAAEHRPQRHDVASAQSGGLAADGEQLLVGGERP